MFKILFRTFEVKRYKFSDLPLYTRIIEKLHFVSIQRPVLIQNSKIEALVIHPEKNQSDTCLS